MLHFVLIGCFGLVLSLGMAYLADLFASEFFRINESAEPPLVRPAHLRPTHLPGTN